MGTKDLAKKQMCLYMRSGVEIWINEDEISPVKTVLSNSTRGEFIAIQNRMINTSDITGLFSPKDLSDMKHRKRGDWFCDNDVWHDRFKDCDCNPANSLNKYPLY